MNDARHNRLFHDITEPSWLHQASHGLSSDLSASAREMIVSELRRQLPVGDYCLHPAVATTQGDQERYQWRREDRLVLDAVAMRLAGEMKLTVDVSTALTDARRKVRTLRYYLGKHPDAWVVQGTIAGFHREIDHDLLYQRLSQALPDEPLLLRLLWQYLHSAVERDGMLSDNERGLLPGNTLFPLLCDHFLEPLDRGVEEYGVLFTRVLDGWVLAAPTRWQLDKVQRTINATLQNLGLGSSAGVTAPVRASAGVELHGYRITPNALSTARAARKRQLFALHQHYSRAGAGTTIPALSAQWDRQRELPGGIHRRLAACPPQIPAAVSSPSSPRSTLPASLWAIPLLSGGIGAAHAAVTTRALNVAVTANVIRQMDFDGNGQWDWGCYGANIDLYATNPNAMTCYGWNGPADSWPTPKWDPTPTADPNALFGPGTGPNFVNNGDNNISSIASVFLPDDGNSYWFRIITSNPSATPRYGWLEIKRSGTTYTIVDFVYDANGYNAALTPAGGGDNAAPAIAIAGTNLSYTENAAATQIDSTATLSDPDGDADWDGGTLEVQITANNEAADEISIPDNIVGTINTSGTSLRDGATTIGTLSASEGTVTNGTKLTITFNASTTNARVQQVLRAISYRNTSDNPGTANRTVTFTATDKNSAAASDTRTIAVTAVNDPPTLTATPNNPGFTENGAAAIPFQTTAISTVESGQSITTLVLTVTNVLDGGSEIIGVDGTDVALTNGTNGTTAANSYGYTVSLAGSTATVTLSKTTTAANWQTLVNGLTYRNTSDAPTAGNRLVTLTSVRDSGGTANGGSDTTALAITSIVTVTAVNDDPTMVGLPTDLTFTEDTAGNVNLSGATLSDLDSGTNPISLTLAVGAGTLSATSGGGVTVGGSGTGTLTLTGTVVNIDTYLNTASNIQYTGAANASGNDTTTLTLTANDGGNTGTGGGGNVVVGTVNIDITPVADTPSVTNTTTDEDTQSTSGLVISRNAADGTEVTHFKITAISGGILYKNDGTTQINDGDFITYAEGNAGLKFTPTANSTATGSFTVQAATDGAGNGLSTGTATATITVTPVNDAPTLTNLNGDSVSYSIGAGPVALDNGGNATVSDVDSADFSGGNVTATIIANGQAGEDVLSVGNTGNITTSGSNVVHSDSGGLTIGTIAGGSSGAPLVITLNANATVARVRDLVSALQYVDTDAGTVNTASRTVRITVDDGDGGASTSANQDVTVNLVRAPLIDLDGDNSSGAAGTGYNGSFTEDGGAVAAADSDNTISDDGTFKSLTVTLTNQPDGAAESLSSSYGSGAQTVNGETVTIGPYDSVTGVLVISVDDGSADATTMQLLIASIRYDNSSDTPDLTNRAITFAATDNDDNLGATATATITVTAVNDAPVFSGLDGTPAYTEDGAAVVLDGNVTVADAELDAVGNYNGATLTLARNGGANADDVFSNTGTLSALTEGNPFNLGGSDLGTVTTNSGGTLLLTFNANATAADVATVLQSLAYSNGSDAPDASVQIDWSFSDGNSGAQGSGGAKSASGSTTVSVTAVNDAPVVSGGPASLGSTLQNVTSTGVLVSNIIGGVSYSDPDGVVTSGIAVTAVTGSGTWEYSTDNTTWTAFPAVSDAAALLLDSASYVRFVPAAGWTGSATLTFQGWDQTSGTASSNGSTQTADATTNGGTTAYSTGTASASLSVNAVPPPPPPPPVPVNGTDSDHDGIPDSWEQAHGLNPNDPNDAGEDSDGDGVSNLEEYRNGTDPQQDDYPPEVTPPADITQNASGLFTAVDPGMADAYDAHDGTVAVERSVPVSTWSTSLARASGALAHFAPGQHTITWRATDQAGNVGTATQTVNIIPQVNLAKDQVSAEGAQVHVGFYLNGPAVDYPVRVPFSVGGTAAADGSDHTLVNGVVTITSGTEGMLSFDSVNDGPGEGSETITVTLGTPENAVAGPLARHTILLVEGNVAPNVTLRATQAQVATLTALQGGGAVVVSSEVVDPNAFDSHHYDWSGSDNNLADIDGAEDSFTFDPAALAPGFYTVHLHVDDGQDDAETELTVQVVTELPPLGSDDSDGDGIDDQTEGHGDSDQDGVPNYLDAIDAPNVLQQLHGENGRYLLETESGLRLLLGQSAREAGSGQTSVDKDTVARTRSGSDDKRDYSYQGTPQDFVVAGLPVAGQTVRVVLPQTAALPDSAEYRVLTQAGWQTFVTGMGNAVSSAAGEAGYCPPPGDEAYQIGLTEGHLCVQLSLQDGGPNDNDGTANGRLVTTGVVAVRQSSGGGGGGGTLSAAWMALLALLAVGAFRTPRRRDDEAGT